MMRTFFSIIVALGYLLTMSAVHAGDPKSGFACYVKPQRIVAISAPVTGILETLGVDQGDIVKAGDVVAVLESSLEHAEVKVARAKAQMEAALLKSEQQLAFSRRKVQRAQGLTKTSAIAAHELDEAETEERVAQVTYREAKENKALAEAELERAEAALALRTITTPIGGIVLERLLSSGELVRQTPIIRIAQLDPLRVDAHVPAVSFGTVQFGMKAKIRIDGVASGSFAARVVGVTPTVEPAGGSFGIRLDLPNPHMAIPAGVTCTAFFAEH